MAASTKGAANGSNIVKKSGLTSINRASGGTRLRVRGGRMQTRIESGKMVLTGFSGGFGGGEVQMNGHLNPNSSQSEMQRLDVRFSNVGLSDVLGLLTPVAIRPAVQGLKVSGSLNGDWQGLSLDSIGGSLNGQFDISLAPGRIYDKQLLSRLATAAGLTDLSHLDYSTARITGTALDGEIRFSRLEITGPEFTLAANGVVDLDALGMDVSVDANVSRELASKSAFFNLKQLLKVVKQEDSTDQATQTEKVSLPKFSLVGSLKNPEVRFAAKQIASVRQGSSEQTNDGNIADDSQKQVSPGFAQRAAKLIRIAAVSSAR